MSQTIFGVTLPPRRGFSVPIQVLTHRGVTAWLVEERSVPVVSLAWSWPGGAAHEPEGREGVAGLAASLLTEGAGDLRATAFSDALRDAGVSLDFSAQRDVFQGGFRALADALPEATRLARLAMGAPRLDADALDRVQAQAVAAARRQLESPGSIARRAFWEAAFPTHPVGRMATPESLAAATRDDIAAIQAGQLRREGIMLAASGAIDADGLRALVEALFDDLPGGAPDAPPELPPMAGFGRVDRAMPGPQANMVFGQDALPPTDPGWEAAQVVMRVLGSGGFGSRLMERVREQRGLTYGIGAGLDILMGRAVIQGFVATDNATAGEVWRLVREAWAEMAAEGPTQAELEEAVAFLAGSLPLQFTDSRRSAQVLLGLQQVGRSPEWLEGRAARLAAITRADAAAVAARLLHPDALGLAVAGAPQGL